MTEDQVMEKVDEEEAVEGIALEQTKLFYEELNQCVNILRNHKLDKPSRYKFQKKVRKVIARHFHINFSETHAITLKRQGNEMFVNYPMGGEVVTLIRFEIVNTK